MPKKLANIPWLHFQLSERRTTYMLIGLVVVFSIMPFVYDTFYRQASTLALNEISINQNPVDTFAKKKYWENNKGRNSNYFIAKNTDIKERDLNKADITDLKNAGIKPWIADRIIKLRSYKPYQNLEDVAKVYGIKKEDIALVKNNFFVKTSTFKPKETEVLSINLNSADSLIILKSKSIGPYFTSKILGYRKKLGGFVALEQLKEIYKFPDSLLAINKGIWECEGSVSPMQINLMEFKPLLAHPYTNYQMVKLLMAYRTQHGSINNEMEFKKATLITDNEWLKLKPYISFD